MAKINITVCMGSSCFARGNQQNLAFLEDYINKNEIDAEIDLSGIRCENKCEKGPNVIINGVEYNNIDIEKLKTILSESLGVQYE